MTFARTLTIEPHDALVRGATFGWSDSLRGPNPCGHNLAPHQQSFEFAAQGTWPPYHDRCHLRLAGLHQALNCGPSLACSPSGAALTAPRKSRRGVPRNPAYADDAGVRSVVFAKGLPRRQRLKPLIGPRAGPKLDEIIPCLLKKPILAAPHLDTSPPSPISALEFVMAEQRCHRIVMISATGAVWGSMSLRPSSTTKARLRSLSWADASLIWRDPRWLNTSPA